MTAIKPFTVLDVTKWFGETSGGVKTYLTEKQAYVERQRGLRHILVIPGERDTVEDGKKTRTYQLRGPHIPTQRPYRFLFATRSFPRIVREETPDVIEVGSPFFVPWLARLAARPDGVPLVNFFHSNFPRLLRGSPRRPHDLVTKGRKSAGDAAWWYLRKLDTIFHTTIVASDFAARELAEAGIERTVRVPLGVDLKHFHPRRRLQAAETRKRHGLPDTPIALYVGRFAQEKDLDVIIDAWHAVGRFTDMTLVLAGDGPIKEELICRAQGARVMFLPYQRDRAQLADLYACADLYVAPGPLETFGLAGLEAMASGLPVLSADSGGVAELVERSGAGTLFPTGCSMGFASVVTEILRKDLPQLGKAGRAYAERDHSWDIVFNRLFEVYRDAAKAGMSKTRLSKLALAGVGLPQ